MFGLWLTRDEVETEDSVIIPGRSFWYKNSSGGVVLFSSQEIAQENMKYIKSVAGILDVRVEVKEFFPKGERI